MKLAEVPEVKEQQVLDLVEGQVACYKVHFARLQCLFEWRLPGAAVDAKVTV